MATINTCLLSPNKISGSPISRSVRKSIFPPHLCSPFQYTSLTRNIQLPAVASIPYPPIDTDYLESEFSGRGVTFTGVNDSCVVRMALENGSIANLMLPSGLITSYKAQMWHGGTLELLHTTVSQGQNGSPVIEGGVSLACICNNDHGLSWSPSSWVLHQVKGDPQESIQVELICTSSDGKIEAKYMVTLQQDVLTSEIKVFNLGKSRLRMMGSVLSHLTVSTPEASYAVGLEGSDFFNKPPFLANFSILPPGFGKRKNQASKRLWDPKSIGGIFSSWGTNETIARETEQELEGEETDNYKHLTEEMSKIYQSAPRNFTLIDRGRRNSVVVGRDGFKEVYMLSPGSSHESYGRYSYICVGQAALLQPIIIESQSEWRGKQSLHNPNM
ncbi:protein NDH-DEPENDENT CYCLIC ELECTRON FLOW 5 [Nicotiana tomentosiformis]|uniref:protein NDH-DEPENDENT CYCLIC ELECTRON FLOW 5 n=1 Tax=Nicotiana tomentosiformis TaxID=4098 RepID=UPI00051BD641|nr:protein NDH-DEPENDENT CYCLIC ELECTRON FLOW 5 [Nicotiana tomentosiformis]